MIGVVCSLCRYEKLERDRPMTITRVLGTTLSLEIESGGSEAKCLLDLRHMTEAEFVQYA